MREVCYEQLAQVEDRLWWHQSRRDPVRLCLRKCSLPKNAAALDVGCGTGGSLDLLSEYADQVVGVDVSPLAIQHARRKHPQADVRMGDANALTEHFEDAAFDLVTLFNVLYHEWVRDEVAVLRQVHRILKPGGTILVTDAAFTCLFRRHDRLILGLCRYRLVRMRALMEAAGFEWIGGTYFNAVSLLPAWVLAMWDRLRPGNDSNSPLGELAVPPWPVNEGMKLAMACERMLIRVFGRLPFGVTLLCLARRSDKGGQDDHAREYPSLAARRASRSAEQPITVA